MTHDDGLPDRYREQIHSAFSRFPEIAVVYIYGSRARGDFNKFSDIDLAYETGNGEPLSQEIHFQVLSLLEALTVPNKIDLVDRNSVRDPLFAAVLERDCKLWWKHPNPVLVATEASKQ